MIRRISLLVVLLFALLSCGAQSNKPIFVASGHPVYAILKEIVGAKAEVIRLVPPGASPHTFQPKPSDMFKVEAATAVFYMDKNADGWAVKLPGKKIISLFDMLTMDMKYSFDGDPAIHDTAKTKNIKSNVVSHDGHNHSSEDLDPHFWTDPIAVKAILKTLADTLSALDPENAQTYRNNAELFSKRLDMLNRQVDDILQSVKGKAVFTYHPSFCYLFRRYSLKYAGAIEESPGKEPTAAYLLKLQTKVKESGANVIFSEPQLPDRSAKSLAESIGLQLMMLDPIGGFQGRDRYSDIILFNARTLKKALQ